MSVINKTAALAIGKKITETETRGLFNLWNDALVTKDPENVAKLYAKKALLLPTVSDVPRTDFDGIKDYFVKFCSLEPVGEIIDGNITIGNDWCQDAGIYEFTLGAKGGAKVRARYTFVYVVEDDEWKISHHHSSMMPEEVNGPEISEAEVKNLFNVWNDALKSLDPAAVANCYSKNGYLLPTVSDKPRDSFELIKDYFVNFLKKKPVGVIIESDVQIGTKYCLDCGIYEFEMGVDGSKVKGRYTFSYVFEDGEWKISHHHSSMMPEPLLAKS